jgi:hypothetical protein
MKVVIPPERFSTTCNGPRSQACIAPALDPLVMLTELPVPQDNMPLLSPQT